MRTRTLAVIGSLMIVGLLLSTLGACAPATPQVVEKVVKETVVVEKEVAVEKEVVKTVVVEKVVTAVPEETVLRIGNTGEIQFLDAQRIQSGVDLLHSDLLYSRLLLWDSTMMNPKSDVAESYTVSDDGLTYVFKLREDVTFHTGRAVTAEDVVYSWDRAVNEIGDKGRAKGELSPVASYEATGPYELTVKLKSVSPVFLVSMGHWALAIVDKETIATIDTQPVGTGPYKFVENIPGDRLVLEKFADYYDKDYLARAPDRVIIIPFPQEETRIAALKAGEVDLLANISYRYLNEIRETPGLQIIEQRGGLTASYLTVAFNLREGPTADVKVRQAIQYAIDKQAIHRAVFVGLGDVDCSFVPRNHWAYEPIACPPRDVEMAKKLLAEAGYPDGLKLTYIPEANEDCQKMAEVLKQSLAEAGIEIEIIIYDAARWSSDVWAGKQFEITDAWYTREPDPDPLMQSVLRKDLGNNVMGYYNPKVEELFDAGKSTLDQAVRIPIYKEIMDIVVLQDVPSIKVQAMPRFAASNMHVQGAYVNPKGYFGTMEYIFVP
jgi:peptide/nickel transport system substrate-binding protein